MPEALTGASRTPDWRVAALLYATVASGFIAMYLPQPILPVLAQEFGVAPSTASLTISALVASLAGASLVIGPLSDRLGRKVVIQGCAFLLVIPSVLCALAPSIHMLLLFRFLQGFLLPGLTAVSVAYITEEFPPERVSTLVGGYIAATVTGGLLSRILSGAVTEAFGWRPAFLLSAAAILLMGVLLARLPSSQHFTPRAQLRDAYRGMLEHLINPRLVGGFLVGFALFFAFLAVFTYLPFYLAAPPFSFSPLQIGLVYVVYAAGIVSSPLAGLVAQRLGRPWVMRLGLLIVVLANVLTLVASAPWLVGALLVLCFGNFTAQGVATSYVATQATHDRGGATALYLFAYYVGGSLGAFLPGLLWPAYGWTGVLGLTVLALMIGLTAAVLLCRE
jgi:YNFM family putative membrane transporter